MRLLITTDPIGGVWTFTSDLTGELLRRGHAVALLSFGGRPNEGQIAWAQSTANTFGDRFHFTASPVPLEWMPGNMQAMADGEPVLQTVAEQFRTEILLSSQFCFGGITSPMARVVIAHSDVLSWAKAAKPDALTPSPWLNQYTSLVQMGLLQADAVLAPTQSVLQGLTANFFLPSGGTVVPNGRRFTPAANPPLRTLQAITAGRLWDEAKGLNLLLGTELPLPVLLAGETTSPNGDAAPPPSAGDVRFLGALSSELLQERFRESAIYLCPSVYEPFGLAPLEAALCGCAVIARDLPSLREVWGENAVFFTDAASLQAAVVRLTADPEALAAAQRLARQRAGEFTVERMTDAYLSVCEAVLRHKARHVA